jgi:hypothetical protein
MLRFRKRHAIVDRGRAALCVSTIDTGSDDDRGKTGERQPSLHVAMLTRSESWALRYGPGLGLAAILKVAGDGRDGRRRVPLVELVKTNHRRLLTMNAKIAKTAKLG